MRKISLPTLPLPGHGDTWRRWTGLADLGRSDLAIARLVEGHTDAVAILAELGAPAPGPDERWGVWAAAPASVRAERGPAGWSLTGERPWCSGAEWCTHALVTAAADDGIRLFAIHNDPGGTRPVEGSWPAIGMAGSDSRSVRLSDARAVPVGGPGDYVDRPGFWHGGGGVAAVWFGGARGVADTLYTAARDRDLSPHALAHLGAVDVALGACRAVLREAAATIDADPLADAQRLALRVRSTVETAAAEVADRVGRALGAGPLCLDAGHARRVVDLLVYVRQSHAEVDLEQLGRAVSRAAEPAW